MKHITTFLTILFITLLSSPSWSEPFLEKRDDGLWYEDVPIWDDSDIPYTGDVYVSTDMFGTTSGQIKVGKRVGTWYKYYPNGQLRFLGNYQDGKKDGLWETYNEDGSLKGIESWKDGVKIK